MGKLTSPLLICCLLSACATAPVQMDQEFTYDLGGEESSPSMVGGAAHLVGWLTGHFDNHLQVLEDKAADAAHPHSRIHSVFLPVTNPALGEHLRYVEQYSDEDPDKVYRRRLYRLRDTAGGIVSLEIASFKNEAVTEGALDNAAALSTIDESQLSWKRGCEVQWTWDAGSYVGATTPGACRVPSPSGGTLTVDDDLYLSATELRIQDRAHDEHGQRVFGHPEGIAHVLKRAAIFRGWAAMRDPNDPTRWIGAKPIVLHDQGSEVTLEAKDGTPLPYVVRLAQRVYQESGTPILKFTVRAPGATEFIAYTGVEPDSSKVGVNLGDFQTGMTREP